MSPSHPPTLHSRPDRLLALLMLSAAVLAACGGSSGGDTEAPAPSGSPASPAPPASSPAADTSFAAIDTHNRAEVVARYGDGFTPLRNTAFSWTGNVAGCNAGDTPLAF